MATALIGLGSNLGDRAALLAQAAAELKATSGLEVTATNCVTVGVPADDVLPA